MKQDFQQQNHNKQEVVRNQKHRFMRGRKVKRVEQPQQCKMTVIKYMIVSMLTKFLWSNDSHILSLPWQNPCFIIRLFLIQQWWIPNCILSITVEYATANSSFRLSNREGKSKTNQFKFIDDRYARIQFIYCRTFDCHTLKFSEENKHCLKLVWVQQMDNQFIYF